ncbi:hypothetical protein FRC07_008953, partial [Ceratobasidium sp. 392]
MSLTEQITSLSKCGHLLYALYRIDDTRFLPGQLVYDIQASIKNAIFCVAKTQLIDRDLPFYLLQTGTDRLENQFGTYRTMTSDRNGDVLQLCKRAASAQHIDKIYSDHPSWNQAPYRLSLNGKSGIDHTNPSSWTGDVIVGHVDLYASWSAGQSQAAAALRHAKVPFEFNPAILAAESPDIDLMRPSGRYPGIHVDNIEPDLQPVSLSKLTDSTVALDHEASSYADSMDALATTQRLGDDELSIEHLLPATPDDTLEDPTKKGWMMIADKPVHFESAVRYLLGSDGGAKSTDRLRRVCGFTRYLHSSVPSVDSVQDNDFHVSELVATFLRVKNQVVLTIIRVTNIVAKDGHLLESLSDKDFLHSGITLSGQLLELEHDLDTWYWTQRYDSATDVAASAHRKRSTGFDFNANISRPISPDLVERNGERLWAFNHAHLKDFMDELWNICAAGSPADSIPKCDSTKSDNSLAPQTCLPGSPEISRDLRSKFSKILRRSQEISSDKSESQEIAGDLRRFDR